jgi:hypothetical protein
MITKRFFAIKPKPALLQVLSRAGISIEAAYPELVSRKVSDRRRTSTQEDLAVVREIYLQVFLRRIEGERSSTTGDPRALGRLSVDSFHDYWDVDVFDDCEDIEDLAADVALESTAKNELLAAQCG